MTHWSPPVPTEPDLEQTWSILRLQHNRAEDIIYFAGPGRHTDTEIRSSSFCVLTDLEELFWYRPGYNDAGDLTVRVHHTVTTDRWENWFEAITRYLVVSSSGRELLMVRRSISRYSGTVFVQVVSLEQGPTGSRWKDYQLVGEVLFLGRGCSRAIWTGIPSPGYVYFIDDVDVLKDLDVNQRDTGRSHHRRVQRALPRLPQYGPWIWLHPPASEDPKTDSVP